MCSFLYMGIFIKHIIQLDRCVFYCINIYLYIQCIQVPLKQYHLFVHLNVCFEGGEPKWASWKGRNELGKQTKANILDGWIYG